MKLIIKIVFIAVFLSTIFIGGLVLSNQSNDDILYNKMDWIVAIFMLLPVLIVEIEIYNICVYGCTQYKNKSTTFFKVLSLAIALLLLGFFVISFYTTTNEIETILLVVFLLYVLLKLSLFAHSLKKRSNEY